MSRLKLRHFPSHHGLLLGNVTVVLGRHGGEKRSLLRNLAAGLAPKIDGAVAVGLEGLAPSNCTFASLETSLLDRLAETSKDDHQSLFLVDAVVDRKVQMAGWHEWTVNLKLENGKRHTTRSRVGLRCRRTT